MADFNSESIREDIFHILQKQGYKINNGLLEYPIGATKDDFRHMNELAVAYKIERSEPSLRRHENFLIEYIANGMDVIPDQIRPKLVNVKSGTEEELLFRYASLHWSIPVSSGYGRRLRFLIMDESNNKLIGLLGLGDPVYSIGKRDEFINWDSDAKKEYLYHVMDAHILGAVPPYSTLLCGKLIALLALSNEVRTIFQQKYDNNKSVIRRKHRQAWLVLLTTTSALGRSSIYNRIKLDGYEFWRSVGFTQCSGEFQFSNGIYKRIKAYAEANKPTAKQNSWGNGFRSKREVIKKCLSAIGLSSKLLYHGIKREIFLAPLASNAMQFLRGEVNSPQFIDWPAEELSRKFIDRWLLPRAERVPQYRSFYREAYRIWPD